ncbi:hypothetical protein ACGFX7_26935 [Streptomyces harbinensis]|uniref:hypothetical protein n=1 Tax=Streptomyces harbinensis TaxID=1176198 RepID=UPI0037212011
MIIGRHTDRRGRSSGERIAAVHRHGDPITAAEQAAATHLLDAMLDAAADHGVTLETLDGVVDLPGAALDALRQQALINELRRGRGGR